jgi:5-methylcytosine-specific restriction endonuclease McrA
MACVICGGVNPPPKKRGQLPKYCSDGCRLVARAQARDQLRRTQPDLVRERNSRKITKWRKSQPESFRAYRRKHYAKNKKRIRAARLNAYNYEKERSLAQRRYARNREHIRARESARRQRADVREKARLATEMWRQKNPERSKENSFKSGAEWRARIRNLFIETVSRKVVFERDKGLCGICLTPVDPSSPWEIDHVIPISKGGPHSYANVQLSHRSCNRRKHACLLVAVPRERADRAAR